MSRRGEQGRAALVEVALVFGLLVLVLAVALPGIMSSPASRQDTEVQEILDAAAVRVRILLRQPGASTADDDLLDKLRTIAPSTVWVGATMRSSQPPEVSVDVAGPGDARVIVLAARSESGRCFVLRTPVADGPTARATRGPDERCRALEYVTGADTGWD